MSAAKLVKQYSAMQKIATKTATLNFVGADKDRAKLAALELVGQYAEHEQDFLSMLTVTDQKKALRRKIDKEEYDLLCSKVVDDLMESLGKRGLGIPDCRRLLN